MTKEEVIEKLRKDEQYAKGRPMGYMLMAICEDDIDAYMPAYVERYRKLTPRQQQAFLTWLADGMYGMLEDAPEYGVKQLMLDTVSATDAIELDVMLKPEADVDSVLKDNTQVRIWRKALPKGAWLEVYSTNNTYGWSAILKDGNEAQVAAAYNMSLASVAVGEIVRSLFGQGYDADVIAAVEKLHHKLLAKEDDKDNAIED